MALTNAERQRRFRERRAAGEPVRTVAVARTPPKDRRPRPKQWTDAVAVLRRLQGEYEAWRDGLPESLAGSRTAELLEGVCDVDLDVLVVDLPRGFGRDLIGGAGPVSVMPFIGDGKPFIKPRGASAAWPRAVRRRSES